MNMCEKCTAETSNKDNIWVWSATLNGYGQTPLLCGTCHDKVAPFLKECLKQFIKKE